MPRARFFCQFGLPKISCAFRGRSLSTPLWHASQHSRRRSTCRAGAARSASAAACGARSAGRSRSTSTRTCARAIRRRTSGTGSSRCPRARPRTRSASTSPPSVPAPSGARPPPGHASPRRTPGRIPSTASTRSSESSWCCAIRRGACARTDSSPATVGDPEVLRAYYGRVHAGHGYTPSEPFLFELHAAMLKKLDAIFTARIPQGSRVLDAGCGRSLFTEIRARLAVHDRGGRRRLRPAARPAGLVPGRALGGGAREPPGLRRPRVRRRVRRGADRAPARPPARRSPSSGACCGRAGLLVLTTPNRRRLANVADGSRAPLQPRPPERAVLRRGGAAAARGGVRDPGIDGRAPGAAAQLALAAAQAGLPAAPLEPPVGGPLDAPAAAGGRARSALALDLIFVARLRPRAHEHA